MKKLKDVEFVDYDSDIININSKNAYISAKKQGETDFQKVITPTTKPYVDFFTPSGERVIE